MRKHAHVIKDYSRNQRPCQTFGKASSVCSVVLQWNPNLEYFGNFRNILEDIGMPKLSVTEAEKLVAVKKSTIYADTDSGKVSFEINLAGIKSSTCRTRPRLWLRETART